VPAYSYKYILKTNYVLKSTYWNIENFLLRRPIPGSLLSSTCTGTLLCDSVRKFMRNVWYFRSLPDELTCYRQSLEFTVTTVLFKIISAMPKDSCGDIFYL